MVVPLLNTSVVPAIFMSALIPIITQVTIVSVDLRIKFIMFINYLTKFILTLCAGSFTSSK